MKTAPIVPAHVDFSNPAAPQAPDFGDFYHSTAGAFLQAQHVFLNGNGLPGAWRGREQFVVLETGFGLGNNFLATLQAWREDPQRSQRLVFISIEKHPLLREDLERAHAASPVPELARQLIQHWPAHVPNMHALEFEQGRVRLLLCLGEARDWLKELVAEVNAFYLDGFAPDRNPEIWDAYTLKLLARLAAPGSTAATWCVARAVRDALTTAGFVVEKVPGFATRGRVATARFAPRHVLQKPAGRQPLAAGARQALIIGAGLAGAACARALMRQGVHCTVVDARPGPAQASSGNPAGLFHGILHPGDGAHARFNRACALATQRLVRELDLPGLQWGMLRLETGRDFSAMQALLHSLRLPADYVQALDAQHASTMSGLPCSHPAWFYPGGGALQPQSYVQALLRGASTLFNSQVAKLGFDQGRWRALDAQGAVLAEAPIVVLAGGHEGIELLPPLALVRQRGQLTHLAQRGPLVPLSGKGYAISDGAQGLWCGASSDDEDIEPALRRHDQDRNIEQWQSLSGLTAAPDAPLAGRVAWRLLTPDRLPLVGGLPDPAYMGRRDQPRLIPRLPGLALCTALGSRGITFAALCGEIVAAQLTGAPCPVESSLLDAVDPARYLSNSRS